MRSTDHCTDLSGYAGLVRGRYTPRSSVGCASRRLRESMATRWKNLLCRTPCMASRNRIGILQVVASGGDGGERRVWRVMRVGRRAFASRHGVHGPPSWSVHLLHDDEAYIHADRQSLSTDASVRGYGLSSKMTASLWVPSSALTISSVSRSSGCDVSPANLHADMVLDDVTE
jgi:hypothetical protein